MRKNVIKNRKKEAGTLVVHLDQLREFVSEEIYRLSQRMDVMGLKPGLAQNQNDPEKQKEQDRKQGEAATGDFGVAGSMMVDSFFFDAIAGAFDFDMDGAIGEKFSAAFKNQFNHIAHACAEAISVFSDEAAFKKRNHHLLSFYPRGRRKCQMTEDNPLFGRFNHAVYSKFKDYDDLDAEMNYLLRIWEELEGAAKRKNQYIQLEKDQTVYDILRMSKRRSKSLPMQSNVCRA